MWIVAPAPPHSRSVTDWTDVNARRSVGTATLLGVGAMVLVSELRASPQLNTGVIPGVSADLAEPSGAELWLSLRGDVMFGRASVNDIGYGPAVELSTASFDDVRASVGGSLQLPLAPLQLVVSGAPYIRLGPRGDVGASSRVFIGSRSYNHSGSYVAAFGLSAGFDAGFGEASERRMLLAAHLDGMWLALPWVMLISWLSH